MNKGVVVGGLFLGAMMIGTIAAVQGDIVGIAASAATMGGCVGYLVGRIDLRKELGLPQS